MEEEEEDIIAVIQGSRPAKSAKRPRSVSFAPSPKKHKARTPPDEQDEDDPELHVSLINICILTKNDKNEARIRPVTCAVSEIFLAKSSWRIASSAPVPAAGEKKQNALSHPP
jgi:hypothetical protein